jgi:hypothetical protein
MEKKVALAALCAGFLFACGGESPTSTSPPAALGRTGTYSGSLDFIFAWPSDTKVAARTTVTEGGGGLVFGDIVLDGSADARFPQGAHYPLGTATLDADRFAGTSSYQSDGCGRVDITFTGRFAEDRLSIASSYRPALCDWFELRGDLAK